jgi:DNA-binding beta-propeller fold protein YncE
MTIQASARPIGRARRTLVALPLLILTGCVAQGVSPADVETIESLQADNVALQEQLAALAPTTLVQAGQLAPAPPTPQAATGWDTPESIRGGLLLNATYDSSGPDAWDVAIHPLVYFTSEGVGSSGIDGPFGRYEGGRTSGVHAIDAYTKEVVASALYDLGPSAEVVQNPHGVGISPDGNWLYIGEERRTMASVIIINARTLKVERVLALGTERQRFHHIIGFTDWQGRDRVVLGMGAGANGGPHYILDPNDDHRVVKTVGMAEIGYKIGHPYMTVDPTGRFLYVSIVAPPWRTQGHNTAGVAKYNMQTDSVTIIPYVGDHPIGMAHTRDGRFTYVNDGHSSHVYKIDNESNTVVANTSSGVPGPYGIALNWDETLLYPIGKGEGSHNRGSVVGMIDTVRFFPSRILHNMPIWLGGSASSVDHGILHPDPEVNELWISNMYGWETIVLDLDTHQVTDYIPTPNGGDTHSGGFVRYNQDGTGELLVDMAGPKASMSEIISQRVAASSPQPDPFANAPAATAAAAGGGAAALGSTIFEETAGGVGCAYCHGMDGRGSQEMGGPDIRGETSERVRGALRDVAFMAGIRLNDDEIAAVVSHLQQLAEQP